MRGLFVRRADYLKTFKVRHKGAEEASLMVGLGTSGGLCTIVLQQSHTHTLFPNIAIPSLNLSVYCHGIHYTVL